VSRCETCRFWSRYLGNVSWCGRIETLAEQRGKTDLDAAFIANAAGTETRLRTLPTFGCMLHEPREVEPGANGQVLP
jgi:hypothetical protein